MIYILMRNWSVHNFHAFWSLNLMCRTAKKFKKYWIINNIITNIKKNSLKTRYKYPMTSQFNISIHSYIPEIIEFARYWRRNADIRTKSYHLCVKCTALQEICFWLSVCCIFFHLHSRMEKSQNNILLFKQIWREHKNFQHSKRLIIKIIIDYTIIDYSPRRIISYVTLTIKRRSYFQQKNIPYNTFTQCSHIYNYL